MRHLYWWWESELSPEVCDYIIQKGSKLDSVEATVGSSDDDQNLDQSYRISTVKWLNDHEIADIIWKYAIPANEQTFNFDISKIFDIQLSEYTHTNKSSGFYDWHMDTYWGADTEFDRKLSVVVQLSDPNEYEGGELMLKETSIPANFKKRGSVIVFPSYLEHCVTPVTKGTRYSLVSWVCGPRWR